MDHNPDRICVWPGYFDAKTSRRSGRRVPRDSSVIKPDLEGLFYAARKVGLRKIKREEKSPTQTDLTVRKADYGFQVLAPNNQSVLVTKKRYYR